MMVYCEILSGYVLLVVMKFLFLGCERLFRFFMICLSGNWFVVIMYLWFGIFDLE